MRKGADIRTYTADEIRALRWRGEDRTDRAKVDAMTEADLERAIAALKDRLLVRLELDGARVVAEERLLEDAIGRIRDVETGPDGFLYLLTAERDGALYRLEPAAGRGPA